MGHAYIMQERMACKTRTHARTRAQAGHVRSRTAHTCQRWAGAAEPSGRGHNTIHFGGSISSALIDNTNNCDRFKREQPQLCSVQQPSSSSLI